MLLNNSIYKLYIEKRLEFFFFNRNYYSYTNFILKKYLLNGFFNKSKHYEKLYLFTIYFLDLNFMHKGWYHLFNLKLKKQSQWLTNNFFLNTKNLKYFKLFLLKNYLNNTDLNLLNSYILIEYLNLLWKLQWTSEWFELKKKRLFFIKKKKKNLRVKIDKQSIFEELSFIRIKFLKKKSKSNIKGNYVALGFEPGNGSIFFK